MAIRSVHDLPTPSLLLDMEAVDRNIQALGQALPGSRLRPSCKSA